jgi:hypothetical protein
VRLIGRWLDILGSPIGKGDTLDPEERRVRGSFSGHRWLISGAEKGPGLEAFFLVYLLS